MRKYEVRRVDGTANGDQKFYLLEKGVPISPWHDIPLYAGKIEALCNMVDEIPRWTNRKFEVLRNEPFNPIKQDVKNGQARFVPNRFPYKGYIWNYGAIPLTWEDPTYIYPEKGLRGDNDPIEACEIGEVVGFTGQIKQVKILGLLALLDEGETDFKIVVIDVNDPLASRVNDIEDVEEHFPGLLEATCDWFRCYKVPSGGKWMDEQFMHASFARQMVNITHQA